MATYGSINALPPLLDGSQSEIKRLLPLPTPGYSGSEGDGQLRTPIRRIYSTPVIVALLILLLSGGLMQQVSVPLWVDAFGSSLAGPYVIVLLSSMFYVVFFGFIFAVLRIAAPTCTLPSFRRYWMYYVVIGACDGINGIGVVYVASPLRVPPVLSAILGNLMILYSMAFTRLVVKAKSRLSYLHPLPLASIFLIVVSTIVSLIPEFQALASGKEKFVSGHDAAVYTIIFIVALAPGVLYNILQEQVLALRSEEETKTDAPPPALQGWTDQVTVLLFGCIFQLLTVVVCFWADLIPGFGSSNSLPAFGRNLAAALRCVGGGEKCGAGAWYLGLLFNVGYSISYLGSIALNKESTNFATIASTIGTPLAAAFWLIFRSLLPAGTSQLPLYVVLPALVLAVAGVLLWKVWERAPTGSVSEALYVTFHGHAEEVDE